MKLRDVINKQVVTESERPLNDYQRAAMDGAKTFPGMDQYYDLYKFQTILASIDGKGHKPTTSNVLRDMPLALAYTEEEERMIADALALLGMKPKELTPRGQQEPYGTNKISPVAQRKEIWELWDDPKITHGDLKEEETSEEEPLVDEGIKDKAAALAAAACIAGTPGCATTNTSGTGDLVPTLNVIDRVSRFSNAGMKELGAQELKDLARGDKNNSVILRMLKQAEAEERQGLSYSYVIHNNGVPTVKYSSYEHAERVMKELESKFPEYKFEIRRQSTGKPVVEKARRGLKKSRAVKESAMMPPYHANPMKGGTIFPDMDQYYELYRFSIAMAQGGDDAPTLDPRKDLADAPMTLAYTDADAKIVAQAAKRMGKKGAKLTTGKSEELADTNKSSPVAQRKELKDLYK